MARIENADNVRKIHGKTAKDEIGYYYVMPNGDQKYRRREESYQQKRSPKQKWSGQAFAWAHHQLNELLRLPDALANITAEWKTAMKVGPKLKTYKDAKGWKFAMLQEQWKQEHPYDQWFADYMAQQSAQIDSEDAAEQLSDRQLAEQIRKEQARLAYLLSIQQGRKNTP